MSKVRHKSGHHPFHPVLPFFGFTKQGNAKPEMVFFPDSAQKNEGVIGEGNDLKLVQSKGQGYPDIEITESGIGLLSQPLTTVIPVTCPCSMDYL